MNGPLLLVSACLCGEACRYDGQALGIDTLYGPLSSGLLLPFCPETAGGLGVPRSPCEICFGRVLGKNGDDCTAAFERGAALALEAVREHGIRAALLKDKSPSCGSRRIYDGTFSSRVIPGRGVMAALLAQEGLTLFTEDEAGEALRFVGA